MIFVEFIHTLDYIESRLVKIACDQGMKKEIEELKSRIGKLENKR